MAKKTARRGKKTTAKKSAAKTTRGRDGLNPKTVQRVLKARQNGLKWGEIMRKFDFGVSQLNAYRAAIRELDPEAIRGYSRTDEDEERPARKKTAKKGKKAAGKKGAKRRKAKAEDEESLPRKRGGRGKGQRLDLSRMADRAVIEALVGHKVTFRRTAEGGKAITTVVKSAKTLPTSKKHGRVVQIKTAEAKTHSIPMDWIEVR